MNKILTGTQAFEALMAGKKIMCRPAGDLLDFDDLDRFPATVFAMPGHEFCVKVEMMELSGIQFAKPLEIHDVQDGQNIFLVTPTCILQTEYNAADTELQDYILNGFVQTDEENAKLQLQAIADLFGRVVAHPMVKTKDTKPKKRRSTKTKNEVEQVDSPALEKQAEPEIIQPEDDALDETDPAIQKAIEAINKCNSDYELQGVERNLDSNKYKLVEVEYEQLKQRINEKREDLNAVGKPAVTETIAPETPADSSAQNNVCSDELSIEELKKLQEEAENIVAGKQPEPESDGGEPSQPTDMLYTKKKETLINRIYEMDSVEALERLAPAIPAAKLTPEDHQAVLQIYAQHKQAMEQVG
ncbi:hypothetical protein [Acinetobacter indicus]|uniref:hypothetical protein n=1 Tax=Acinetobacter indicus TaxID=756892 RepID=UPI000948E77E|nr:hypothetical protein [Acinetobacter indicus]